MGVRYGRNEENLGFFFRVRLLDYIRLFVGRKEDPVYAWNGRKTVEKSGNPRKKESYSPRDIRKKPCWFLL